MPALARRHIVRCRGGLLILSVLAALAPAPMNAQTLDAMIARALEHHPSIRAAESDMAGARALARGADAWPEPEFGFEFMGTPITSFNPIADAMEYDWSLTQMIHFPGRLGLMGDMARLRSGMVAETAEAVRREVIRQVREAHAMLHAEQRHEAINDEQERTMLGIIEAERSRFAVAQATQADLSRLEVELLQLRNERTDVRLALGQAWAMLRSLAAVDGALPPGAVEPPPTPAPPPSSQALEDSALARNPAYRAMQLELDMRRTDLTLARREWLPDLMVRGVYKQLPMGRTDAWSVMFGFAIPIAPWSSPRRVAREEGAELSLRSAGEQLQAMEAMLRYRVHAAWLQSTALWERLTRHRMELLPRATESLAGQLALFRTNQGGLLGLLDAWRMVKMYTMEAVMIEAGYVSALARLEELVGGAS